MKSLKLSFFAVFIFTVSVFGQHSFISYYELKDFLQASPGAFKYGLYGFNNPATTTYLNGADVLFTLSQKNNTLNYPNRWGLFIGNPQTNFFDMKMPSNGLGIIHDADSTSSVYDFRYSYGFGNDVFSLGTGFGYSFGDRKHFNRGGIFYIGAIYRPLRQLSLGFQRTFAFEKNDGETVGEIAIRPIGNYPLTFFADAAMFDNQRIKNFNWSAGISWEIIDGLRINGRYFKDKSFALALDISLGHIGFASQSHFDNNQKYGYNTYSIRIGAEDRTFINDLSRKNVYVKMDLKGSINYLKFLWFDNRNRLMDIIDKIDVAEKNSSVKGLLINISGINANREILWEIRNKLKEFKSTGKKVIIFMDRADISLYQFASVADKVIIDPLGMITLQGYALGKSYYKKLLDNLGIGFDELRYFKYKSAYESFARNKMSEGDKEQLQKLVDDWYENSRNEICESRAISHSKLDSLVNDDMFYTPEECIQEGLVDTIARWNNLDDIIKKLDKKSKIWNSNRLWKKHPPRDDKWGEPSKTIAVVYALGVCAMDNGIKARNLSAKLKKLSESNNIGAIVLRVDSPGGDAMASDLVAEVIKNMKGKKPIIVSQGFVAASGGYWLSMDADTILAAPMTITGSIGVISAWIYNKGIADSMGINTEIVKHGKYADLGFPFTLPFIPIGLPNKNLNDDERMQIEKNIKKYYKMFVDRVADGRGKSYDEIHKIAQGRVWSGSEGEKIGLVDVIGGLDKAIAIAKEKAGYGPNDDVNIYEYPNSAGLFDFTNLFLSSSELQLKEINEKIKMLKFRIDNNGIPMPFAPLEFFDFVQDK